MLGKNHMAVNTASYFGSAAALNLLADSGIETLNLSKNAETVLGYLSDIALPACSRISDPVLIKYLPLVVLFPFFLLGGLLPDIDERHSALGKLLIIRPKHRGFTHSIWFVLIIAAISWYTGYRSIMCIALGCLLHDLTDAVSNAGIDFIYPFGRGYQRFPNGGMRASGHRFWLYSTGKTTEDIVRNLAVITNIAVIAAMFVIRYDAVSVIKELVQR